MSDIKQGHPAIKRLDIVRKDREDGSWVVLGLGGDFALIGAIYNIATQRHATIPNRIVPLAKLQVIEPYGGRL